MDPDPPIVLPAASVTVIRLNHGTDLASANDILANGLDANRAARYNGSGDFWASTDPPEADWFAKTNIRAGVPARLEFEIDELELRRILDVRPEIALFYPLNVYHFLPASLAELNRHMKNLRVVLVP